MTGSLGLKRSAQIKKIEGRLPPESFHFQAGRLASTTAGILQLIGIATPLPTNSSMREAWAAVGITICQNRRYKGMLLTSKKIGSLDPAKYLFTLAGIPLMDDQVG